MNFIKEVFLNLLDGNRLAEQNELKRRRAAEEQVGEGSRFRQWYKLVRDGQIVGFSYVCSCGIERKLIRPLEWFRKYGCKTCGDVFELLKFAGVPNGCDPAQYERYLSRLPLRTIGSPEKQRSPYRDTWADDKDPVEFAGHNDGREWV
jgi:hypothetical protein